MLENLLRLKYFSSPPEFLNAWTLNYETETRIGYLRRRHRGLRVAEYSARKWSSNGVLATYSRVKPHVPAAVPRNKHFPRVHPSLLFTASGRRETDCSRRIPIFMRAMRRTAINILCSATFRIQRAPEWVCEKERERNIQWNTILESSFVFVPSRMMFFPSRNRWPLDFYRDLE